MADKVLFKSFYDITEADSLCEFLRSKNIDCRVEKRKLILDTVYAGHSGDKDIYLLMEAADFDKANRLIDEEVKSRLDEIDKDYYLYSFTDAELMDVVAKPDEWNNQDVLISQAILADRGKAVSDADIATLRVQRTEELAKPEKESNAFLTAAYLFTPIGGIYGIIFAAIILTLKKVLPDGRRVPVYNSRIRGHARILLVIGILIFLLWADHFLLGSTLFALGPF